MKTPRRTFLQSILALLVGKKALVGEVKPVQESDIAKLEEEYCKACNALSRYRDAHGFLPGARVRCQFRDDPPKTGTIPPYGEAWYTNSSMSVPVVLDAGYRQPWTMSNLTLITSE